MPNQSNPSMMQKIIAMLRGSPGAQPAQAMQPPPKPPQMGGMAGNAQGALGGRAYQLYAQEMMSQGMQPLPPEQWAAQQGR
jgi:hypothetical protein